MISAPERIFADGRTQEYRDARRLAAAFEVVADLLLETSPEEWEHLRVGLFGSPEDRHANMDDRSASLCFYQTWTHTCNALAVLPPEQLEEMANELKIRAVALQNRARLRIRWRRSPGQPPG